MLAAGLFVSSYAAKSATVALLAVLAGLITVCVRALLDLKGRRAELNAELTEKQLRGATLAQLALKVKDPVVAFTLYRDSDKYVVKRNDLSRQEPSAVSTVKSPENDGG